MKIKKSNKSTVFVPMAADIIHHGHINILKKAKKMGFVIVGLMTDSGIATYKRKKPIFNYKSRYKVISNLKFVDKIIPLEGLKYCETAKKHKFNYFLHGSDWKKNNQSVERQKLIKLMKNWNGKVIDIPYTRGISSSYIKKKIING